MFGEKNSNLWTFQRILLFAFLFRLLLIYYGIIHDYLFDVSYTDIDYKIFSDAAELIRKGKWLFCGLDVFVGHLTYRIICCDIHHKIITKKKDFQSSENYLMYCAKGWVLIFWLVNPLTIVISSRGNADVIVCASVLLTLYLLARNEWLKAAFVHGIFAVHFKLYPVIYLPSIFFYLSNVHSAKDSNDYLRRIFYNTRGFIFILISILCFLGLTGLYFAFFGYRCIQEFVLYHVSRTDTRHNFSPYFYIFYLSKENFKLSQYIGYLAFVPQAFLIFWFAFRYHRDLPFCWFLTTLAFVSFNKVCTSQYFLWYLCLLPLIPSRLNVVKIKIRVVLAELEENNGSLLLVAFWSREKMVFYLIGIGLGDIEDITVKGFKIVKKCEKVYLDSYTSILSYGLDRKKLEEFYGKEIIDADRDTVEQASDVILENASSQDVCLLVVGDPFAATTHTDLVLRAKLLNVPVQIVHNASIISAVGCCGLQLYKFGEIVSIVAWTENWQPDSFFDKINANKERGLHTLCLLDIKTKEQSVENLMKGLKIFEKPNFLTCSMAAEQLIKIIERRVATGSKTGEIFSAFSSRNMCVGLARIGWPDQKIVFCSLDDMCAINLGPPLHSLIIPGDLHPLEIEMLKTFT
ncbi:unnamed protein product [Dracunculus medinensis]|uniref:GPI alpha-1,4-mannosyltransferase I, catalytic subunit n=1 Tax=Dracunculus medinensis TaxID=318479 RepID=A0A0N4U2X7_DRAME|nr:unnamed protein product [Dracunculus medinensis]